MINCKSDSDLFTTMMFYVWMLTISVHIFCVTSQTSTPSSPGDYSSYNPPQVNLTSCIGRVAVFSIADMQTGGLIYLRTRTGVSKVETSFDTNGEVYTYQCTFEDCGIEWYEKFTFISQRHANIQTKYDLHQTFICLADLISITPGDGATSDTNTDDILRHWYRATAEMKFYNTDEVELESGSFVKLGDHIDVYINLTNNIADMFDLSVRSCDVILLPIIEDRCPMDVELFGQFTKLSTGYLYNNFSMFRPTSTAPGAMDVLFTCTLEICRNPCPTYVCNGTEAILVQDETLDLNDTSRRKRQAESATRSRLMRLGTRFRVDYEEPVMEMAKNKCMETTTLVAAFTSLGVILFASVVSMLYYIIESRRKSEFAKSKTKSAQKLPKHESALKTVTGHVEKLDSERFRPNDAANTGLDQQNCDVNSEIEYKEKISTVSKTVQKSSPPINRAHYVTPNRERSRSRTDSGSDTSMTMNLERNCTDKSFFNSHEVRNQLAQMLHKVATHNGCNMDETESGAAGNGNQSISRKHIVLEKNDDAAVKGQPLAEKREKCTSQESVNQSTIKGSPTPTESVKFEYSDTIITRSYGSSQARTRCLSGGDSGIPDPTIPQSFTDLNKQDGNINDPQITCTGNPHSQGMLDNDLRRKRSASELIAREIKTLGPRSASSASLKRNIPGHTVHGKKLSQGTVDFNKHQPHSILKGGVKFRQQHL